MHLQADQHQLTSQDHADAYITHIQACIEKTRESLMNQAALGLCLRAI